MWPWEAGSTFGWVATPGVNPWGVLARMPGTGDKAIGVTKQSNPR